MVSAYTALCWLCSEAFLETKRSKVERFLRKNFRSIFILKGVLKKVGPSCQGAQRRMASPTAARDPRRSLRSLGMTKELFQQAQKFAETLA